MLSFLFGLLLPVLVSSVPITSSPRVALNQGKFTGITLHEDYWNVPVNAFLGIPYAQPPVGDLRLRPPVALNFSSAEFNATAYGMQCPQATEIVANTPAVSGMSEDCLTINIFQPTGVDLTKNKIPVGINLHPGAFNSGTGESNLLDN